MIWNVPEGRLETTIDIDPDSVNMIFNSDDILNVSSILCLDWERRWVTYGRERLLLLPSEFRTPSVAVHGSTLAYENSQMMIIDFKDILEL